jgi:hypothetical protein
VPSVNVVHDEIAALWKLADPYRGKPPDWEGLALALESLSPQARKMLAERGAKPSVATELPTPAALRGRGVGRGSPRGDHARHPQ